MTISFLRRIFIVTLIAAQLSACAVVAVGGVTAGAVVMADRRSPAVQELS